jgi:hypothetical protein
MGDGLFSSIAGGMGDSVASICSLLSGWERKIAKRERE